MQVEAWGGRLPIRQSAPEAYVNEVGGPLWGITGPQKILQRSILGAIPGYPGKIWHQATGRDTPPHLLGPPLGGGPGGTVPWGTLRMAARGHPWRPSLPHHFQHSVRCSHTELGDTSRRVGFRSRWFWTGHQVTCKFFYADNSFLAYPWTALLQSALDVLMGLFGRVGLFTNVNKTVGKVWHTFQITSDSCGLPTGGGWRGWYPPSRRGSGRGLGARISQRSWQIYCWCHATRPSMRQSGYLSVQPLLPPQPPDSTWSPFCEHPGRWDAQWRAAGGGCQRAPTYGFTLCNTSCGTL